MLSLDGLAAVAARTDCGADGGRQLVSWDVSAAGAAGNPGSKSAGAAMAAEEKESNCLCLLNATVLTGDYTRPRARAVAIGGSCITAVGTDAEVRAVSGPRAKVVDCQGGTVLPGFIDAHVHLLALARSLSSVDLSRNRAESIAALCNRLREAANADPDRAWIRGHGYDEFYLRERRHPTCRDLDQVVADRPVRLRHRTRHASVLNSAALRYLAERAPDLLDATGVERDPSSGEATGVLFNLDAALAQLLPRPTPEEIRAGLARASDLLLAVGVTAVDDASLSTGADEVRLLREAVAEGTVRQRVRCLWGVERHGFPYDPSVTAVKLAAPEDANAAPDFAETLIAAHRQGLQVAVHAVEGPAISVALAAFESALGSWPRPHRHRLEHCALCPPPLLDRIGKLGLAVVAQPGFLSYVGDRYLAEVPASEQSWLYPLRGLADRGVPLAGSSDAPVGPLAPLVGIAAAVGRRASSGALVVPEQAIGLEEALSLYGRGAAHVTGAGDTRGWLATGRIADLVILRDDLDRVPIDGLGQAPVAFVVIDGTQVLPRGPSRT